MAVCSGAVRADSTIKVLVNDLPITSYDIAQRASLMALAGEKGGEKVALDQLIDEAVEMSEAKKRGFVASDARVASAYTSIAGNMKLTPAAAGQGPAEPRGFARYAEAPPQGADLVAAARPGALPFRRSR